MKRASVIRLINGHPQKPDVPKLRSKHFAAVPGKVDRIRTESGLRREGERTSVEVSEYKVAAAGEDGLGDVGLRDADAEVVIDGPETGVEEIMGRRGQGQTVIGGIRASLGVGMDVCCL